MARISSAPSAEPWEAPVHAVQVVGDVAPPALRMGTGTEVLVDVQRREHLPPFEHLGESAAHHRRGRRIGQVGAVEQDTPLAEVAVVQVEETADQAPALLRTTSLYFRIDEARRPAFEDDLRRLVDGLGGTVETTLATVLMTARRTDA